MNSAKAFFAGMILMAATEVAKSIKFDEFEDGFDLETEYRLIQDKKSKYSSNDRKKIINMYNRKMKESNE